jgi:leucyl aminopeptidase
MLCIGVGQGSIRGSYLATIEWNGAKNNSKPLAFVGKVFVLTQAVFHLSLQSLWRT